MLTSNH